MFFSLSLRSVLGHSLDVLVCLCVYACKTTQLLKIVETLFITLFSVLFCHSPKRSAIQLAIGMCSNAYVSIFSRNILQLIFIFIMTDIGPTEFGTYVFPKWADALGWILGSCTLLPFVVAILYHLLIKKTVSVIWWYASSAVIHTSSMFTSTC